MSPDSLRRKFSLQGEDAQQWLAERGFLGEFDTTFRLVSDEIRFEGFGAARVWHSEGSYEIARRSPTALLIVQIEGESTLQVPTWGEASRVISPGDVAVLPGGGGGHHSSLLLPARSRDTRSSSIWPDFLPRHASNSSSGWCSLNP